jgi:exodeoxyribonuclease V alpha subunit
MVGGPGDRRLPFAQQGVGSRTLLLTRRMYREQERLAEALRARAARAIDAAGSIDDLDRKLERLFPGDSKQESAEAVRLAAERHLAVIIGGPGTGKTFSVSRLLGALVTPESLAPAGNGSAKRPLAIALAAPTGKAAARMREALREATAPDADPKLEVDDEVRTFLLNLPSQTLHRLLGVRPDGSCRHHRENPIPADVVVVDEVSMVNLALMRQLVEAVRPEARLVLLGDRDQLASVEAGCVLADLVDAGASGALAHNIRSFTISRRFSGAPDIGLVAACLQSYETAHKDVPKGPAAGPERLDLAVRVLAGRAHASAETAGTARAAAASGAPSSAPCRITALGEPERPARGAARPSAEQLDELLKPYLDGFKLFEAEGFRPVEGYAALLRRYRTRARGWKELHDPAAQRAVLEAFERYRVLAVHRRGPLGVSGLERALAAKVRAFLHGESGVGARYWIGRPILVTENAYDVRLMNGDVGLVLPTPDGLAAVFLSEDAGGVHAVATSRLPPHEGALAMTVHKSQGSQFERVALVLAGRPSPIQTRELVYTGVTRAKNQLAWLGGEAELRAALDRPVERASGLGALLMSSTLHDVRC